MWVIYEGREGCQSKPIATVRVRERMAAACAGLIHLYPSHAKAIAQVVTEQVLNR